MDSVKKNFAIPTITLKSLLRKYNRIMWHLKGWDLYNQCHISKELNVYPFVLTE